MDLQELQQATRCLAKQRTRSRKVFGCFLLAFRKYVSRYIYIYMAYGGRELESLRIENNKKSRRWLQRREWCRVFFWVIKLESYTASIAQRCPWSIILSRLYCENFIALSAYLVYILKHVSWKWLNMYFKNYSNDHNAYLVFEFSACSMH